VTFCVKRGPFTLSEHILFAEFVNERVKNLENNENIAYHPANDYFGSFFARLDVFLIK